MSERLSPTEHQPQPKADLERMAAERLREIERSGEHQPAQHEALAAAREQIHQVEQAPPPAETPPVAEPAPTHHILTKGENYRQTMVTLRHRMKPAARSFSKLVHAPAIEAASEAVGKTVLRPSISLGATTTAVLLTGFMYFYARYYGFELRGSEIWLTLIVGAVIGLLVEMVYKTARRLGGRL
jgi:hypothetical protein